MRTPCTLGLAPALFALCASGCGKDNEYLLVSGAGPEVVRDAWLERAEVVPGDGASRFASQLPPQLEYLQPAAPRIRRAVELRGLPRAVLEADRVYSLSLDAGLVVTDVSDPVAPRVLARQPVYGEPVGLVVQGGVAHVLVNGPSLLNAMAQPERVCNDDGCEPPQSRLVSIDAREPESLRFLSEHVLLGTTTNAHRIADALYVVSQSFEGCGYECLLGPTSLERGSLVTSFDLADPAAVQRTLELPFEGQGHRRFSFGAEHLYLVEQPWPPLEGLPGPELRSFDLSATGSITPGASVLLNTRRPLDSTLEASWKVVEAGQALHVFVNREGFVLNTDGGSLDVEGFPAAYSRATPSLLEPVPMPAPSDEDEPASATQIDGARLFALTAADTLVAYDVSDPLSVRRMGSVVLPSVDGISVSGNRVLAWGLSEESANLALVDVSNLAEPIVLDSVSGSVGSWTVDASTGMFVRPDPRPLASRNDDTSAYASPVACRAAPEARSMQVLDPSARSLAARGEVEDGAAVLVTLDRFLSASDRYLTSAPPIGATGGTIQLEVVAPVFAVGALGDQVAAFGQDSFTRELTLDIGSIRALTSPSRSTDVAAILGLPDNGCEEARAWGHQVFEFGTQTYVTRFHRSVDASGQMTGDAVLTLQGLDRKDPAEPAPGASLTLPPIARGEEYAAILATERALIVVRKGGNRLLGYPHVAFNYARPRVDPQLYLDIVDLSDPRAPRLAASFEVPEQLAAGDALELSDELQLRTRWGWSLGPLFTSGSFVVGQHARALPDGRVEYYLDRLDVSDPSAPVLLEPISVPGHVLSMDMSAGWLVTLDTLRFEELVPHVTDCGAFGYSGTLLRDLSKSKSICRLSRRVLNGLRIEGDHVVRESQLVLDAGRRAILFAGSGDEIFYVTEPPLAQDADPFVSEGRVVSLERIVVRDGRFERLPSIELSGHHRRLPRRWQTAAARGQRFFSASEGRLGVVDFGVDPPLMTHHVLPAAGCSSLEVAGDTVFCAAGEGGLVSVDLER